MVRVAVLIVAAAMLVAMSFTPADAQRRALVSNVFVETDLRQAIEDIAAQANINIIADPSVQGVVSVTLDETTVEQALDLILAGTPYRVQRTRDYFLIFTPDEQSDIFPSVADTRMFEVQHIPAETARVLLPDSLQRYVRVDPGANTLAVTAPPDLMSRIIRDLDAIDLPSEDTVFVALTHVRANTARTLLPEPLQRFVRADPDRNTLAISAPLGSRKTILDQIAALDQARRPGQFDVPDIHPVEVVKLQHAKAVTAINLLPPAALEYVRADEATNTLSVSAPEVLRGRIMRDIATLDAPRRHIMLDARVVVLERSDLLDFGAEWRLPTITAGTLAGSAVGGWPWELSIGYGPGREFTNALSLTLNMLSQNNEATIIASPQVLAQDGIESEIRVTTEEYFQITSDVGTFIRAELEKIETGTILRITPQIGPTGELTLDMNIEVSDVVARGEQNLPVVSRRTARSTVQVQSGGTAAIAGLADTRSQLGTVGFPGSQSVPLLGRAFRTDTLNHQARQVAVFVTATLVNDRGGKMETTRVVMPPLRPVDENSFKRDLEAALNRLEYR